MEWPKAASARSGPSCTGLAGWRKNGAAARSPTPSPTPSCPRGRLDDKTHVQAPSAEEVRQILGPPKGGPPDRRRPPSHRGDRDAPRRSLRPSMVSHRPRRREPFRSTEASSRIQGGASIKSPRQGQHPPARPRPNSLKALARVARGTARPRGHRGVALADTGFAFSFEPGGLLPPHPDALSHAFTRIRNQAQVPADVHLHSLRHFHATALDPVISEAQKQTRLGWSTVQMARHYTDGVDEEDRRAAEHIGRLLD